MFAFDPNLCISHCLEANMSLYFFIGGLLERSETVMHERTLAYFG